MIEVALRHVRPSLSNATSDHLLGWKTCLHLLAAAQLSRLDEIRDLAFPPSELVKLATLFVDWLVRHLAATPTPAQNHCNKRGASGLLVCAKIPPKINDWLPGVNIAMNSRRNPIYPLEALVPWEMDS